jgi:UDP-N-acetylglucosamine 1-carboxyvinyltransferase
MAAALNDGVTIVRNASPNYMVQDLCFFLQKLGVKIDGIGTTTLTIQGVKEINKNVEYYPSEDPIEAMSFIAAAIVTKSEITIRRTPIEFLEIELEVLSEMGFEYALSDEYLAKNGKTRLVDITTKPSKLKAPVDKIHPLPFPGLNIDNLPFFALIATQASGRTLIHDWVYENRAIYLLELTKLNARVQLLDPHRVYIEGPTKWRPTEIVTPPALRPAVVIFLAMLAAPGVSTLRNVYSINRGYEDLALRLNSLGAKINVIHDLAS